MTVHTRFFLPLWLCRQNGNRMEGYTNSELADMHHSYGAIECNGRAIQRFKVRRYPTMQTPSHAFYAR
ncbi:hypothetical protein TNCV_502841 [Trichonephila clavipes]|nr:hypothetical protein TNCV_502841 [Trichonephila clavipes]